MAANMYRVGDYVYFESHPTSPFQIRRIEELNKTTSGNVEAKVMCFYRRRDLDNDLNQLADKHQTEDSPVAHKLKKLWTKNSEENSEISTTPSGVGGGGTDDDENSRSAVTVPGGTTNNNENSNNGGSGVAGDMKIEALNTKQKHQLKHRELFLSRQMETLPATHIRGKCSVTLFNETESLLSYLNKDDAFFYCLVYDHLQKTLIVDKGEIRVGSRYQVDTLPQPLGEEGDERKLEELESLVWTPTHGLTDRLIDQFLVISRSVGTFARALDCSSSVKQPSLHMSAAAASRDITLFHAMDTLHKHNYDVAAAISSLVPSTGPVLCRDEMEEWSASEANLFEEALEKYEKDFNDIRTDFLPWKSLKNIIEYYYMWKTTDRYVQQKRVKAVEAESKLKQVYIPNYNKPNPAVINNKGIVNGNGDGGMGGINISGKACESCNSTSSSQWYSWGPSQMHCKLCSNCWNYWKKYGGLKNSTKMGFLGETDVELKKKSSTDGFSDDERTGGMHRPHRCSITSCGKEFKLKAHLARHYATAHGIPVRSGSPRPIMKTRTAFYLYATPITRVSRRVCRHILLPRHATRAPFWPINISLVKQECQQRIIGKSPSELRELMRYPKKDRGSVTNIATRLAKGELIVPEWLAATDPALIPRSEQIAFPRPPKGPDGSIIYERIPNKPDATPLQANNMSPTALIKKRPYEDFNGLEDMPEWAAEQSSWSQQINSDAAAAATGVGGPPPIKRPFKEGGGLSPGQFVNVPRHISGRPMVNHLNGKIKISTRVGNGRKQVLSCTDAPDDMYFRSTDISKRIRKTMTSNELRKAARKPWRVLRINDSGPVILD